MATDSSYRKVGRGGAGNYHSPADVTAAAQSSRVEDIEAQAASAGYQLQVNPNRPPPEYSSGGRGGAGNLYQPSNQPSSPSKGPPLEATSNNSRPSYRGRGGAGNFRSGADEMQAEKMKQETETQKLREEIIRDVELGLKPPERAHLGEGRIPNDKKGI